MPCSGSISLLLLPSEFEDPCAGGSIRGNVKPQSKVQQACINFRLEKLGSVFLNSLGGHLQFFWSCQGLPEAKSIVTWILMVNLRDTESPWLGFCLALTSFCCCAGPLQIFICFHFPIFSNYCTVFFISLTRICKDNTSRFCVGVSWKSYL